MNPKAFVAALTERLANTPDIDPYSVGCRVCNVPARTTCLNGNNMPMALPHPRRILDATKPLPKARRVP